LERDSVAMRSGEIAGFYFARKVDPLIKAGAPEFERDTAIFEHSGVPLALR